MFEPKQKEDEPMDTGENTCEGDYEEEGEIQSDDEEVFWTEGKAGDKVFCDPSSYGLPPSSILELKKLSRAKRFGIPIEHGRTALVNTSLISNLYKTLGIDENNEKNYCFNVVHMRGTENMSTSDVFDYFTVFNPAYIEWINDISCNIVWTDHFSAAKALLSLSKEIKNLDKIRYDANPFKKELELETKEMEPNTDADAVDAREIEGAIPPGQWRIGVPSEKSKTILLRFATKSDKKQKFAEKNSEYYRKYGNPHYPIKPAIVSTPKGSDFITRFRQGAKEYDEYMREKGRKNPWGNLAEEWGKQDGNGTRYRIKWIMEEPPVITDLRSSLGNKSESDDGKDKFPKMKMYADEEARLKITTLRAQKIPIKNVPYVEDLRQRLNRSRKRKQQIEEEMKSKRVRFLTGPPDVKGNDEEKEADSGRSDDAGECAKTDTTMKGVKEFGGEVDFDKDPDKDKRGGEDADDDEDDDDEKGANWALENYSDLRDSLSQGKKQEKTSDTKKPEKTKSNAEDKDGDHDDDDYDGDDIYKMDVNRRSPLQIEFENDDYFEKQSN